MQAQFEIGDLDRRIILQRSTTTKDSFGQKIETFTTLAIVWASYMPVSDGEKQRASETYSNITARFRIRWALAWADLNTKDRVSFDNRVFDILVAKEIGRRVGFEITAAARGER